MAPGALFVALKDTRDGHDFVAEALAKGASAAMVSRVPEGVADNAPLLVVGDVLEGLRGLAAKARKRMAGKVIGITGSVGKTSTKEMLRVMLAGQGHVHAAEKSYNNHWGVPLTLARMPSDADFAIIEIGMNAPGEISPLAKLADLDAALITTVAPAHLAAFDSVAGIAREKASILEGLRDGGLAVLNAEIETAPILMEASAVAGARCICFGKEDGRKARLTSVQVHQAATVAQIRISLKGAEPIDLLVKLNTPGAHFAMNATAALGLVAAIGGDATRAALDIAQWTPYTGRGVRERIVLDAVEDGLAFELIDDAYNANPASVGAALDMLATMEPTDGTGRIRRGRRIFILGDMLELGPTEDALHADLAAHPAMREIDLVHCIGPRSKALWDALPRALRGQWEDNAAPLTATAGRLVDAGDIVLVKGSLGMRLAPLVDALRKLGQAQTTDE